MTFRIGSMFDMVVIKLSEATGTSRIINGCAKYEDALDSIEEQKSEKEVNAIVLQK